MGKKIFKVSISIILTLVVIVAAYISFMIVADYKPKEKIVIDIENNKDEIIKANSSLSITTFNIGYGTMDDTVDFFMDGGVMSRGTSEEKVLQNLDGIESIIKDLNSDIVFLQEVDVKATRSYKINQLERIKKSFSDYSTNFAINFKVPWVPIPLFKPHGQVLAGLTTLSKFNIESSTRHDLPGKSSFFVQLGDLDRAMVINRFTVDNGKELVAINAHLSAYDKGGAIRKVQLGYINSILEEEYLKGNYVIIGGDWNQQIPGTNAFDFPTTEEWPDWLQDIPEDFVPKGYSWAYDSTVATSRTVATPYIKGENLTSIIDGFLVSDNIEVVSTKGTDQDFKYSDHNPVTLEFRLK